jgi:hypothetical protein
MFIFSPRSFFSEGLPGVVELAQRLKDPGSSMEMKAVMAAGLSR